MDNRAEVLRAQTIDSPWVSFEQYTPADLMNADLVWPIRQEELAEKASKLINEFYLERQRVLKKLSFRLCDGLPSVIEHCPLLIVETNNGEKAIFLDYVWNREHKGNKPPSSLFQPSVRRILCIAVFDKSKLCEFQHLFYKEAWSQVLMLSDFERKFLSKGSQNLLLPHRQAQYEIFRYLMVFSEMDSELVKTLFSNQKFDDLAADLYKKAYSFDLKELIKKVKPFFVGPIKKRNQGWDEQLSKDLELAGESYVRSLFLGIMEFLTLSSGQVVPALLNKEQKINESLPLFVEFAKETLPNYESTLFNIGHIEQSTRYKCLFQEIEICKDKPIENEQLILKTIAQIGGVLEQAIKKSLPEKDGFSGEIAATIMSRFLSVFHARQATYQLEDIYLSTGIKATVFVFDDGFDDLMSVVFDGAQPTHNITLENVCYRVAQIFDGREFSENLSKLHDLPAYAEIMSVSLNLPEFKIGDKKCSILNTKSLSKTEYPTNDLTQVFCDSEYIVFANIPYDNKQLCILSELIQKSLKGVYLYSTPTPLNTLEQDRLLLLKSIITGVECNKGLLEHNYKKYLLNSDASQRQILDFLALQETKQPALTIPVLKNCIRAGEQSHVLQRIEHRPKRVQLVCSIVSDMFSNLIEHVYEMVTSDRSAWRQSISTYSNIDKNPEAVYFEELPNDRFKALYIYYKQLQLAQQKNDGDKPAKTPDPTVRFVEYLLKGYLQIPFFILRNEGSKASIAHLFNMQQNGLMWDYFDETQQIALILHERLPPSDVAGIEPTNVVNAISSGESTEVKNSIHRDAINRVFSQEVLKDIEKKGNFLLRGEFLIKCTGFDIGEDELPIRELSDDEMQKVLDIDGFRLELKAFFDLVAKIEDQIMVIPSELADNYLVESII